MGWMEKYVEKKVYIILKDNRRYTGKIISIDNSKITIIDKFSKLVTFDESEINLIEEEL